MASGPVPVLDGVLARKNAHGSWAKRYFRTLVAPRPKDRSILRPPPPCLSDGPLFRHNYHLNYYTSNLAAIEKSYDASQEHFK